MSGGTLERITLSNTVNSPTATLYESETESLTNRLTDSTTSAVDTKKVTDTLSSGLADVTGGINSTPLSNAASAVRKTNSQVKKAIKANAVIPSLSSKQLNGVGVNESIILDTYNKAKNLGNCVKLTPISGRFSKADIAMLNSRGIIAKAVKCPDRDMFSNPQELLDGTLGSLGGIDSYLANSAADVTRVFSNHAKDVQQRLSKIPPLKELNQTIRMANKFGGITSTLGGVSALRNGLNFSLTTCMLNGINVANSSILNNFLEGLGLAAAMSIVMCNSDLAILSLIAGYKKQSIINNIDNSVTANIIHTAITENLKTTVTNNTYNYITVGAKEASTLALARNVIPAPTSNGIVALNNGTNIAISNTVVGDVLTTLKTITDKDDTKTISTVKSTLGKVTHTGTTLDDTDIVVDDTVYRVNKLKTDGTVDYLIYELDSVTGVETLGTNTTISNITTIELGNEEVTTKEIINGDTHITYRKLTDRVKTTTGTTITTEYTMNYHNDLGGYKSVLNKTNHIGNDSVVTVDIGGVATELAPVSRVLHSNVVSGTNVTTGAVLDIENGTVILEHIGGTDVVAPVTKTVVDGVVTTVEYSNLVGTEITTIDVATGIAITRDTNSNILNTSRVVFKHKTLTKLNGTHNGITYIADIEIMKLYTVDGVNTTTTTIPDSNNGVYTIPVGSDNITVDVLTSKMYYVDTTTTDITMVGSGVYTVSNNPHNVNITEVDAETTIVTTDTLQKYINTTSNKTNTYNMLTGELTTVTDSVYELSLVDVNGVMIPTYTKAGSSYITTATTIEETVTIPRVPDTLPGYRTVVQNDKVVYINQTDNSAYSVDSTGTVEVIKNAINEDDEDVITSTIKYRQVTGSMITGLSNNRKVSVSPLSDLYKTFDNLRVLDKTWNKDSNGNVDFTKYGKNKYLTILAMYGIINESGSLDLSSNINTGMDPALLLYMTNAGNLKHIHYQYEIEEAVNSIPVKSDYVNIRDVDIDIINKYELTGVVKEINSINYTNYTNGLENADISFRSDDLYKEISVGNISTANLANISNGVIVSLKNDKSIYDTMWVNETDNGNLNMSDYR